MVFEEKFSYYLDRLINRRTFRPVTPELYEASTSGSWEFPRSLGGQREYVRQVLSGNDSTNIFNESDLLFSSDTISLYGSSFPSFKTCLLEAVENLKSDSKLTLTNVPNTLTKIDDLVVSWICPVKVQAVCEPLKVRMISKGKSLSFYLSQFFQKAMWRFLQQFAQFSLTGKSLDNHPEIIDLIKTDSFDSFVSGDYKAATDNLNIRFTKIVFEKFLKLSDIKDDSLLAILRSVIYETLLSYPHIPGFNPIKDVYQINGQLMGSTLSFPILCIVNAICYWMAFEEYHSKEIDFKDLPVLVNGDDILFKADMRFYEIWKKYITKVGFKLSLGKNFFSKDFFTINSKLYTKSFKVIPYINIGLLVGSSKLSGGLSKELSPIWDDYNKLMLDIPKPLVPYLHRRFVHYHKSMISKLTDNGKYNLFLPKFLGGLGLNPHVVPYKITNYQKYFASYLFAKYSSDVSSGNFKSFNIGLVKSTNSLILSYDKKIGLKDLEFSLDPTRLRLQDVLKDNRIIFKMANAMIPISKEIYSIMREGDTEFQDLYGTIWKVKIPTKRTHFEFFESIKNKEYKIEFLNRILNSNFIKSYHDPFIVIKDKYRPGVQVPQV